MNFKELLLKLSNLDDDCGKDSPTQAQKHDMVALQMFTQLGAIKDVEKMEKEEW